MLKNHFESAGASTEYGDTAELFPVEGLDATVLSTEMLDSVSTT